MQIYHERPSQHVDEIDRLLLSLAAELTEEEVEGSHLAKVWIGTGLQIAAQIVERRRIALLCDEILQEVKAE